MVQFYCLSVILNIICALILIYNGPTEEKINEDSFFSNSTFRLIVGILCAIVGFVKIFFVYHKSGNAIPFFGDFLVAFAGIFGGVSVLLSWYMERSETLTMPEIIEKIFITNKFYIGIACLVAAVLHFIAPGAIIL